MMTLLAAAALAAAAPQTTSLVDSGYPPVAYQGDTFGIVFFVDDAASLCGVPPPGYRILGCHKDGTIVMPNPCKEEYVGEAYAKLMCHEMGHRNGWPGDHPRP